MNLYFSCSAENDLYKILARCDRCYPRYSSPAEAVEHALPGSAVLLLADGYPERRVEVDSALFHKAADKNLRLYVEYPSMLPGIDLGEAQATEWERVVVSSDAFGESLSNLRIIAVHDCHFIPVSYPEPLLVVARVAGYNTAVYGLPENAHPILFEVPDKNLIAATTKLSGFVTGRYAPAPAWKTIWEHILAELNPESQVPSLQWEPTVYSAFSPDESLPEDAEIKAFKSAADWFHKSKIMIHPSLWCDLEKLMKEGVETIPPPDSDQPEGDGSLGMLEGYAAKIRYDGNQVRRLPVRADCHAEAAAVLALDSMLNKSERSKKVAENLLDFVYFNSAFQGGDRGNPEHPAFGLIAWGTISPAWDIANYGDDNARVMLATMAAAAGLESDRWDEPVLKCLLANLRTTGTLGFRGERIDMPDISKNGWKHYHDAPTVHPAPHFESYLWACNLWAYDKTGYKPFLEKARNAIKMTMDLYPDGWRWANGIAQERARMLLCLAWLVRVDDTPEHRDWIKKIAGDMLANQQPCGAIREELGSGQSWAGSPQTNEAYGTGETPLIQENGDPASDQLYTEGFALLGLHEAAAATGDPELKEAEDRLTEFLVRIQVRSEKYPYLDGAWFRAFDYKDWDYWASSADIGWGAWSIESGWGQAWNGIILGLREKGTSLWDITSGSRINDRFEAVQELMEIGPHPPTPSPVREQEKGSSSDCSPSPDLSGEGARG